MIRCKRCKGVVPALRIRLGLHCECRGMTKEQEKDLKMKEKFCRTCGESNLTHNSINCAKLREPFNGEFTTHELDMGEPSGKTSEVKENVYNFRVDPPSKYPNKMKILFESGGIVPPPTETDKAPVMFDYSEIEKRIIAHSIDKACPTCLNNPAVEKIFTANEISMKLYDAKFRGIIDGDQLFKLLDYFEEKENDED